MNKQALLKEFNKYIYDQWLMGSRYRERNN